jgi:His/Glu/Gln/Arg/opine family amino acid ABC transporter permease subunit
MASIGPNELFFLLQGLKWTLALTIIGFIGGGIFGLCVALARVADSPAIQRASTAYIAIFQGTPLLMQLFVVYYGVALAGLNVDAPSRCMPAPFWVKSGAAASRPCRKGRRKRPMRSACITSHA